MKGGSGKRRSSTERVEVESSAAIPKRGKKEEALVTEEEFIESDSDNVVSDEEEEVDDVYPCLGIDHNFVVDVKNVVEDLGESMASAVLVNLYHPRYRSRNSGQKCRISRSDRVLHSMDWNEYIIGKVSSYLYFDGPTINNNLLQQNLRQLEEEIRYGIYLNLKIVLLPPPVTDNTIVPINYCRSILGLCQKRDMNNAHEISIRFWIPFNIMQYDVWRNVSQLLNYDVNVSVALILSSTDSIHDIYKWIGVNISCILVPYSVFVRTKGGKKSSKSGGFNLPPDLASFILELMGIYDGISIVLTGRRETILAPDELELYDQEYFLESINSIYSQLRDRKSHKTLYNKFCDKYKDSLRTPLQPLINNLESNTYRIMEQDPVKYLSYRNAIKEAILEKHRLNPSRPIRVVIIGAGRGPLVVATIKALKEIRSNNRVVIPVNIYIIEKNKNAVITLTNRFIKCSYIKIITGDVRYVLAEQVFGDGGERADIMMSELLGSFGDNELSPEIIKIAMKNLLLKNGINIPQSYDSYVNLLSSTVLYQNAKQFYPNDENKGLETNYVVNINAGRVLCPSSAKCFSFSHFEQIAVEDDLTRYHTHTFQIDVDDIIHGLAGYFETNLYKDIVLSTVDQSKNYFECFSWFPMFFPLKKPLVVKRGDSVEVHMWRCTDNSKVWYEYQICTRGKDGIILSDVHNVNGRSFNIGL